MTAFWLGFYTALVCLMLVTFAIIHVHEGRRMSWVERAVSLVTIFCWPLLALGIAMAVLIQRLRKRVCPTSITR